ncbi:MAG: aldo/keto reductase [Candidatus Aenigmatarchaeota archaeon]
MEFKTLTGGFKLPVLGIGTWGMGGNREKDTTHDKEDITAIKTAIELGMIHIDTAEIYGAGHTEELVREAIKGFDRSKIFITSKVSSINLKYDDVIAAAKRSLKRLNTNYMDLYLIHGPNPDIPIEETMKAMDFLMHKKLVKNIGVSNFSVEELKEAQKCTKNKIVANQIEYNLSVRNRGRFTRNMESEIIPYCQENDIFIVAWRPLALGLLAKPGFDTLDRMAKKYNKTRAQIALNWLISKKNVVTIVKAANVEHIKENLGVLGWRLEQEDMAILDKGL